MVADRSPTDTLVEVRTPGVLEAISVIANRVRRLRVRPPVTVEPTPEPTIPPMPMGSLTDHYFKQLETQSLIHTWNVPKVDCSHTPGQECPVHGPVDEEGQMGHHIVDLFTRAMRAKSWAGDADRRIFIVSYDTMARVRRHNATYPGIFGPPEPVKVFGHEVHVDPKLEGRGAVAFVLRPETGFGEATWLG